jgi:SNF2 family DNA or RNA helicase
LLKGITQLRRLASSCSGKTLALVESFRLHRPGTRSLIFCNYLDEIESVTAALRASRVVDVIMPYVGKMSSKNRNRAVNSFMERRTTMSKALIIQIQAGSVGLNLQAASRVYIMSPHWNATTEQQAIARAHRTGTTHVVEVTRFVVKDTVEEYMHNLQQEKLSIAATTLVDDRLTAALNADETIGGTVTWMGKIFDSHIFDEVPPNDANSDSDMSDADV